MWRGRIPRFFFYSNLEMPHGCPQGSANGIQASLVRPINREWKVPRFGKRWFMRGFGIEKFSGKTLMFGVLAISSHLLFGPQLAR